MSSDSSKKYYLKNKEKVLLAHKVWAKSNLEKRRIQAKNWAEKNREKLVAAVVRYQKKYPARVNAMTAAYEAQKIKAMPSWANKFFMEEAYDLAQRRTRVVGFKWQVDHIVPLRSKIVCGLHVHNNLQVIPAKANVMKGNRIWQHMP